ncbi:hypothetical protein BC830DRAFT_716563 [Chytriomyces sp. MP71]|nr:hypothetical protein BC830DRAFT_716563 [Chytriomyces sp. MP71]
MLCCLVHRSRNFWTMPTLPHGAACVTIEGKEKEINHFDRGCHCFLSTPNQKSRIRLMTDSLSNFFGRLSDFSRVANVSAGETLPDVPTSVSTAVQAITASDAILGAVAIVIGAALMLLGFRLYRPTLFVTGAVIGGVITYSLLVHFRPSAGYEHEGDVLTFVPITLGLICGSILMCVVEVALILVAESGDSSLVYMFSRGSHLRWQMQELGGSFSWWCAP